MDEKWTLMVNGAMTKSGAGIGIVLITSNLSSIEHALKLEFPGSNNEVEYKALVAGLLMASELRVRNLRVYSDSNLVIGQMTGEFLQVKDERKVKYKKLVEQFKLFENFYFEKINILDNEATDELVKVASLIGDN